MHAANLHDIQEIRSKIQAKKEELTRPQPEGSVGDLLSDILRRREVCLQPNVFLIKSKSDMRLTHGVNLLDITPSEPTTYTKGVQANQGLPGEIEPSVSPANEVASESSEDESPPPPRVEKDGSYLQENPLFLQFLEEAGQLVERELGYQYSPLRAWSTSGPPETPELIPLKFYDTEGPVTHLSWSPQDPEFLAAAQGSQVIVYSIYQNQSNRCLNCRTPISCVQFDPFNPNLLVAGAYSGNVLVFDLREKKLVQRTPLSVGHDHPIVSLNVLGTQNSNVLISSSAEGKLASWCQRHLVYPVQTWELSSRSGDVSLTSIGFPQKQSNRCVIGTSAGLLLDTQLSETGSRTTPNFQKFSAHDGPVMSVDFHPRFDEHPLVITSSLDWSVQIFGLRDALFPHQRFDNYQHYVLGARWSPTHPYMFAVIDGEAHLDLYNLKDEQISPFLRYTLPSGGSSLGWSSDGSCLGVSLQDGGLQVLGVPPGWRHA